VKKELSVGIDMQMKANTRDVSTLGQPEENPQSPSIKIAHLTIEV